MVHAEGDTSGKEVQSYVFVSDDGSTTHIKTVNGETVTEEIHGDHGTNVWVSETGDTTKIKHVKVIEIDGDHDGEKTVFVKKVHKDHDEVKVTVDIMGDESNGGEKMVFISDDGEEPLIIVDGKEMKDGSIEDIAPDTIESINVFKGDKAVEKYGEKGKDGVIIIKTKK